MVGFLFSQWSVFVRPVVCGRFFVRSVGGLIGGRRFLWSVWAVVGVLHFHCRWSVICGFELCSVNTVTYKVFVIPSTLTYLRMT